MPKVFSRPAAGADDPPWLFGTIVADPPWPYATCDSGSFAVPKDKKLKTLMGAAAAPEKMGYPTMTIEAICSLQIPAATNAHLYVWTTNSFMVEAHEVAKRWGFKVKTILTWGKVDDKCRPSRNGVGYWFRGATEHCLFCVNGKGKLLVRNAVSNLILTKRLPHSVKPDWFYDMVRAVSPGPLLEMFARKRRLHWSCWGNEVESDVRIKGA